MPVFFAVAFSSRLPSFDKAKEVRSFGSSLFGLAIVKLAFFVVILFCRLVLSFWATDVKGIIINKSFKTALDD